MIKRFYFYHATYNELGQSRFIYGIVTVKSWLPDPVKAYDAIIEKNAIQSDNGKVNIDCINRV
jgi:hypothetical protein